MKIAILFIILLTTLFPSIVYSGEIYGCIKKDGKFVKKGVKIEITPESKKEPYSDNTDEYGIYSLSVPETGECTLRMKYMEQPVYIKDMKTQDVLVYSFEGSVQYDFFIIEEEKGKYSLRRK